MALDLSKIKKQLQDHLQEGLLIVVGTGLSTAEGIPDMGYLAKHLKTAMPARLARSRDAGWQQVVTALDGGDHLEAAMGKASLDQVTVGMIIEETARIVRIKEREVFERVLDGKRILPFTVFAKHLFKAGKRFHLITPNYDRLIELATEAADIGVDSRFFGYVYGRSDPKHAADAHRESFYSGKTAVFRALPCLCVHKPHGSLDWFDVGGKIVRCPEYLPRTPIIITPGASKYRESFRWAFDDQRTAGNKAAASATRHLFIGYGFNDDHLEQYLCSGVAFTKPTVIITMVLSNNAMKLIVNSNRTEVIALSAVSNRDHRTRVNTSGGEELIVDEQLWNLEGFNKGVL